jgi:hypothetical protein
LRRVGRNRRRYGPVHSEPDALVIWEVLFAVCHQNLADDAADLVKLTVKDARAPKNLNAGPVVEELNRERLLAGSVYVVPTINSGLID